MIGLDFAAPSRMVPGMNLTLNGEAHTVPDRLTIAELLKHLRLDPQGRAVAVNLEFIPRSAHARHPLREGDEVEIVAPMQGG